jgi:hypothetical protein
MNTEQQNMGIASRWKHMNTAIRTSKKDFIYEIRRLKLHVTYVHTSYRLPNTVIHY